MDTSGRTVLGAAGGGNEAQAKQMFGKEEMAAILRFGAEELFRGEGDEAHEARVGQAVMEEELDTILARAEVGLMGGCGVGLGGWGVPCLQRGRVEAVAGASLAQCSTVQSTDESSPHCSPPACPPARLPAWQVVQDTGEPIGTGRMGDLLGQFNVATFQTSGEWGRRAGTHAPRTAFLAACLPSWMRVCVLPAEAGPAGPCPCLCPCPPSLILPSPPCLRLLFCRRG